MQTDLFDYPLPEDLIARAPAARRDHSRLLVFERASGKITHTTFAALPDFLPAGARLFRNNATVLKARLRAQRPSGGKVECLLLRPANASDLLHADSNRTAPLSPWDYICLLRPGRRLQPGETFGVAGQYRAEVIDKYPDGENRVRFTPLAGQQNVVQIANLAGELPLPPYIEQARIADLAAEMAENARTAEGNTAAARDKTRTTSHSAKAIPRTTAHTDHTASGSTGTTADADCTANATANRADATNRAAPHAATASPSAKASHSTGENPADIHPSTPSDNSDEERYQTVYADPARTVAAAAPTAGLHFTPELLAKLQQRGTAAYDLTLHVGLDTFRPILTDTVEAHRIHRELYEIPATTRLALEPDAARPRVAVGTTSLRSIEHYFRHRPQNAPLDTPWIAEADIFIYPPARFAGAEALITNFHLPRSTLLCLVSAFLTPESADGIEILKDLYRTAIDLRYRFFSYGDAMLII